MLLDAKDENDVNISPKESAKILGITFNKALNWREYVEVGKNAMVPKLKRKLGALKFTSRKASRNAKIKLAHGCIMSNITYGLQVLVLHCSKSVLKKVQGIHY